MKNMTKLVLVVAVMFLGISASAQTLKIGHVNMEALITAMPEVTEANGKLETKQAEIKKELESLYDQYQTKIADYQKTSSTLSDAVRQTKEQELQELGQRIQKFEELANNEMQKMQQELMAPVYDKAMKAVEAIGKENGFTYILTSGALIYAADNSENILPLVKKKLGIQ